MNKLLLAIAIALFITHGAYAAEPLPGDSCTAGEEDNFQRTGGKEIPTGHLIVCKSGTWRSILSWDAAAAITNIGNLTCTNGQILKFTGTTWTCAADSTGGAPSWASITGVPAGFADGTDDGITSESDPQVGTLTASKWCASNAGGTAVDCTQNAPGLPALASSKIWVGDAGGAASAVSMSGDATLSNAGALTIASNAIGSAEITDASVGLAELSATGTKNNTTYLRGDNTWATISGADNLGNHTATANLNMQDKWIQMSNSGTNRLSLESQVGFYRMAFDALTLWDHQALADIAEFNEVIGSTGLGGLALKRPNWNSLMMDGNASTKSLVMHYGGDADNQLRFGRYADNFGGWEANVTLLDIDNGNLWTAGSVTAASFVGNGAGLTGVPGDNLGAGGSTTGRITSTGGLPASQVMATATGGLGAMEATAQGSAATAGAAFMSFHRPSSYAAYFGLDTDNKWKVGGWSMGANSYEVFHQGKNIDLQAQAITSSAGTVIDGSGGWHRTYGNTGWYNSTYGGGWYMTDTTWLRAYNSKSIYTDQVVRADAGFDVDGTTVIDGNGKIPIARISATGTPSSSTYLRGDGSWQAASGGGGGAACGATPHGQIISVYANTSGGWGCVVTVTVKQCMNGVTKTFTSSNGDGCPTSCFASGTRVLLADGSAKAIEDLIVGDKVFGRGGKINTVLALKPTTLGDRRLYTINRKLKVTGDHPALTQRGWGVISRALYKERYFGRTMEVTLADGEKALWQTGTLKPEEMVEFGVGDKIAFGAGGFQKITSLTYEELDATTPLYTVALDGDGTMQMEGGFIFIGLAGHMLKESRLMQ